MVDAVKNVAKKASIGIGRMSVTMWCVAGIVVIIFLGYHYGVPKAGSVTVVTIPKDVIMTAIGAISLLGGVDIFKKWKSD